MVDNKPLGQKAYGSIPHLPGSRLGIGDHHVSLGQAVIATEKVRDRNDLVIVQEKLDGSNVAVAKVSGEIIALTRAGYLANTSKYNQHLLFEIWVNENKKRFFELLNEGERVSGEWLAMAHGTKYILHHEPFVPFDLITKNERVIYNEFESRVLLLGFTVPNLLHKGGAFSIDNALSSISISGHGAIDKVEGAVWRIERKGSVDFLCKYVRRDKEDGKYFSENTGKNEVWNVDISKYLSII